MSEPSSSLRRFNADQYGAVDFEGQHVPCAFGGQPGQMTALILVQGVCQIMEIPVETEIERIRGNHLLSDGLFLVPFLAVNEAGKPAPVEYPAITLTRLHTWLAMIPPESVANEAMRQKLVHTQQDLTDVVYAYFGRRLLPQEIRAEDDRYLDAGRKEWYDRLEAVSRLDQRLTSAEQSLHDLSDQVDRLSIAISAGEGGENITADQQEMLRAMMDLLSARYEAKHGKGTRGALIRDIKDRHNFRFYNTVSKKSWPGLVRDCVARFHSLNPAGTPLPRVFQIALNTFTQDALF